MSRTYRIPNFLARCPRKTYPINVNLVTLEEEHNRWVDSFPLFGDEERTGCKRGQIPLFASCCYPTADLETLHAVVSHMIALIFLDHANDTATVEEAEETAKLFISAFDDPSAGLESPNRFVRLISRSVGSFVRIPSLAVSDRTAVLHLEQLLLSVRLIKPIVAKQISPSRKLPYRRRSIG
ncbi:hypothetical protein PISMIDRAFT_605546 [Pisolithus microcarpus 441]|uniref:Uncharacterized protein n=1 Tax=Pisolithus microcarpus 441 TaxID=765257 RepID=A0A0C9ZPV6_9AGAM|nr:hypothetical protein PISMIDRAFT_605546 [Pisolithus microcarpus 441]